jgi:hypothetical protein
MRAEVMKATLVSQSKDSRSEQLDKLLNGQTGGAN